MNRLLRHPGAVVAVILALTVFLGIQIPKTAINNEVDIFLPESNRSKIDYNKMKETFGSQTIMDVAVSVNEGTIFNADTINLIKSLSEEFEKIENVEKVTSLTNADYIEGTAEGMTVSPIAEDFTGSDEEIQEIRRKLSDWKEMYELNLVSQDLKSTQILVKIRLGAKAEDKEKVYHEINRIISLHEGSGIDFHIAGDPAVIVLIERYMKSDLARLVPFVILVVLLTLYLCFRTAGGVILPVITVLISTIWTVGLMSLFGVYFTLVSTTLPVLLIAVGSAYGIHLVNDYYSELRSSGKELTREEHGVLVVESLRKVGKPVLLAALTTVAGFISLATSPIVPLKQFALFSAIGVTAALLVTVTMIPSLLILRHHALKLNTVNEKSLLDRFFKNLAVFLEHRKKTVTILCFAVLAVSIAGMFMITIDNILISNFSDKEDIRVADNMIRENFGGTKIFSVIVSGREKGDMTNPEILKAMDSLDTYLETNFGEIGKVISFSDFVKRMNKVMHYPETSQDGEDTQSGQGGNGEGSIESMSFFSDASSDSADGTGAMSFFQGEESADAGEGMGFLSYDSASSESAPGEAPDSYIAEEYRPLDEKKQAGAFLSELSGAASSSNVYNPDADTVLKELYRLYNYRGEAYNEIPSDPSRYPVASKEELKNLISQYLLLYSGNLEDYSDDAIEPSKALMIVQLKTINTVPVSRVSRAIKEYTDKNFPEGYEVTTAGIADMENALTTLITGSQIASLAASLVLVFIILSWSYKSFAAGLFGIVPLAFTIIINFGIMGFSGIRLDMVTALIASIAVGIGIDYTIHFMSAYNRERIASSDLETVTERALSSTGRGILFNACAVAAGFMVLCFSNFTTLRYIGFLTALTMFTSSFASLTVLPVLLNFFKPSFMARQKQ